MTYEAGVAGGVQLLREARDGCVQSGCGRVNRWAAGPGTASLGDAKRSGRPPRFTPVQVAQVKALACTPAAEAAVPIARWSCPELARQAVTGGICASLSASTVRRWLSEDAIKPWQHQSWIFIRDPNFAAKAARVLDLYARTWDGMPLGADEYVISADEKTSIQARCRCRCHPSLPPGRSIEASAARRRERRAR